MKTVGILVLSLIAFFAVSAILDAIKRSRVPKKTTQELKALFARASNFTCIHQAALELKRRGEDIAFTFPVFLDMSLTPGVRGLIGRGCLQTHFGDKLRGLDLSGKHMSEKTRRQLTAMREQTKKRTSA